MKFSENWLRQHVRTDASRDELVATLTAIGLEVEDMVSLGDALEGVVVARIVSAERHPEADRLQVCLVDAGLDAPLQIVCGAPNARPGLVAPLARIGTRIGELTIKAAKLRGVESNGMLCSARELGIDADASGLLELPADAPVGAPLAAYLGLPDASIEIKLTPNRADCFSVHGIAFDVAAACGSRVVPIEAEPVPAASEAALSVVLGAGADAPRYLGRVIEGVDATRPTPVWMAERLRRSGIRPVRFLVDVTQYVMLELGQPMHAFDRDRLTGPVGVRRAHAGETLTLLDGRDVSLDAEFLAITDGAPGADRVVALAGVMGGFDTRVTESTRNVFLEAAHFAPDAIIGRSRRLGLHTDAAHRFERGVDPALPPLAIERATRLILDVAGGTPGPLTDVALDAHRAQPKTIGLRRARLQRVLGLSIDDADVERILHALGLDVSAAADGWRVVAPTRRFDLAIEEDLIEEVIRIHGYDRVPTTLPGGATRIAVPSEARVAEAELRRQMVARDCLETINFAFVDAALLAAWNAGAGSVPLANPLSGELGVMRPALLPGLVAAVGRNLARQQSRVRLFELGKVFRASAEASTAPVETLRVAAAVAGAARAEQWSEVARPTDYFDLKGDLEALARIAGTRLTFARSTAPHGHPGRSADILHDGVHVGWIGELHPRLLRALDIDAPVLAFELDAATLQGRSLPRVAPLSRFPSVRRDLAVVAPEAVSWSALESAVRAAAGPLLADIRLFDRYAGQGVETGSRSLAIGLILQENSRTLTDRDVDGVVAEVVAALQREHGAALRS
ncbi:phenylalanine--tRNA ligase subunit beta [Luteimonas deserti]|uniref:Phenylalanine--tRNA ligase beta subunit n=1 Tax=Luteimonas deserti TaxID=2752306 RepID=A0A7Z0QQ09_9GAMM|nr:phenylalanine--tRNA ligase subunit beta [Luteimonas deserti]NYZ62711.1 phenylalanine--tRNA ligase subunit beta [Luteimonas deserti]